jgi:hypothetical protein
MPQLPPSSVPKILVLAVLLGAVVGLFAGDVADGHGEGVGLWLSHWGDNFGWLWPIAGAVVAGAVVLLRHIRP